MQFLRQLLVYTLAFLLSAASMLESSHAAMISTEQLASHQSREISQLKISQALARPELASQLESLGVSPEQARLRVAALTEQELATLADQTDRLPAGGDFFGTVGVVFIILLITDILGFTKIFPFTRAQR